MSYDARVFTVLVASPGDVQKERQAIAEIIHEWNNLNSRDRSIVLLPLRWETHAHPEMGSEPQAIINRQIVDGCDMAVGVFWTRLGTPTTTAESGSAEEIARVGESGKPVMVYFSNSPVPPGDLDLPELSRLRDFQKQQYPQGLVEQYSSIQEFREKFARQISAKIMEVAANDAKRQSAEAETSGDVPDGVELLALSVAREPDKRILENPLILHRLMCANKGDIPDYTGPDLSDVTSDSHPNSSLLATTRFYITPPVVDKNYYRKLVEFAEKTSTQTCFSFALEAGNKAVSDVHVQMRMTTEGSVTLGRSPIHNPPSRTKSDFDLSGFNTNSPGGQVLVSKVSRSEWAIEFDVPVVQVGRRIFSPALYVHTDGHSTLRCEATVYSSESKPFLLAHEIQLEVVPRGAKYAEILSAAGEELDPAREK